MWSVTDYAGLAHDMAFIINTFLDLSQGIPLGVVPTTFGGIMRTDPFFNRWAQMTVKERQAEMRSARNTRARAAELLAVPLKPPKPARLKRSEGISDKDFRRQQALKKYDMTIEQWDEMFHAQGECCAMCNTKDPGVKGWNTDHCHKKDQVRAILCLTCNLLLGHAKDKIETLMAGVTYLLKFNQPGARLYWRIKA